MNEELIRKVTEAVAAALRQAGDEKTEKSQGTVGCCGPETGEAEPRVAAGRTPTCICICVDKR